VRQCTGRVEGAAASICAGGTRSHRHPRTPTHLARGAALRRVGGRVVRDLLVRLALHAFVTVRRVQVQLLRMRGACECVVVGVCTGACVCVHTCVCA